MKLNEQQIAKILALEEWPFARKDERDKYVEDNWQRFLTKAKAIIEAESLPDDQDREAALQILNLLCPLTRRDSWWNTQAPQALLEDFLANYRDQRLSNQGSGRK